MKTLYIGASASAIFAASNLKGMPRIALEPPDPAGAGNDPPNDPPKPTDAEAKLLKEVMGQKTEITTLKEQLAAFDGVNPADIKAMLAERKTAAVAAATAAAAQKEAERKAAEAAGDVERVKQMMAEEHKKEISTVQDQLKELQKTISGKESVINDLTIGQSFSNSNFVKEELVLTPNKTRTVYGQHFAFENGKVVAYDKPAGEANRTPLVDARGEALDFDAALKKLVEIDPDRDYVMKSKMATGANSKPGSKTAKTEETTSELSGVARIAAILNKNGGFKASVGDKSRFEKRN